jgi:hypothetical protein
LIPLLLDAQRCSTLGVVHSVRCKLLQSAVAVMEHDTAATDTTSANASRIAAPTVPNAIAYGACLLHLLDTGACSDVAIVLVGNSELQSVEVKGLHSAVLAARCEKVRHKHCCMHACIMCVCMLCVRLLLPRCMHLNYMMKIFCCATAHNQQW